MEKSFTVLEQVKIFYGDRDTSADVFFNKWRVLNHQNIHRINKVEVKLFTHDETFNTHMIIVYYDKIFDSNILAENPLKAIKEI